MPSWHMLPIGERGALRSKHDPREPHDPAEPHPGLGQYQLICGDSRDMALVGSGEAALVSTSPPYFPPDVEAMLFLFRRNQSQPRIVWERLVEFAESLAPVYQEIARVVGNTGIVALEIKDIRYGDYLLPLAAVHARLAMSAGLWMRSRIWIEVSNRNPHHAPKFECEPDVGSFRTFDCGQLLIFAAKSFDARPGRALDADLLAPRELIEPRWRVAAAQFERTHPHQSPPELIRRLIKLYTTPGELVVDPFAGSAQTLRIAASLGRRAVGYEIDPARVP